MKPYSLTFTLFINLPNIILTLDYEDMTFNDFLKSQHLTDKLSDYVKHLIAEADYKTSAVKVDSDTFLQRLISIIFKYNLNPKKSGDLTIMQSYMFILNKK